MTLHTVTLTWDAQNGITNLSSLPANAPVRRDDKIKFVANPDRGTPLVVFPDGSPFDISDKPYWIFGTDETKVTRSEPSAPKKVFTFLCAVLDGNKVRGGTGGQSPPIRPM